MDNANQPNNSTPLDAHDRHDAQNHLAKLPAEDALNKQADGEEQNAQPDSTDASMQADSAPMDQPQVDDAQNRHADVSDNANASDKANVAGDEASAGGKVSADDEVSPASRSAAAPTAVGEDEEFFGPWRIDANDTGAALNIDGHAVEPQPPAVAFAPGFLAVDENGQTVSDDAVEQIEAELHRKLPSLGSEPLEAENLLTAREIEDQQARQPTGGAIWTIPLMCLGIAIIACCLIIPLTDENHQIMWEREKLRRDLDQLQKQVDVNDRFLAAVTEDSILAQRLVQRQLNVVRAGTTVLKLNGASGIELSSPFQLVNVPEPAAMPAYVPVGGRFAELCRQPRTQLYMIGGSLLLIAASLVLGRDDPSRRRDLAP